MPTRDFELLSAFLENNGNFSQIRSAIPADWRSRLDFLYMLGDFELDKANSDFDLGREIIFITKEIEREYYKESLLKIGNEISKCEADGSNPDNLTKEFQDVSRRLLDLSKK